jgi:hypothetical protein
VRTPLPLALLLSLPLTGCALGALSEEEACDLAARWLGSHSVVMIDAEEVHGADVTKCTQLQTREDVGEASIRAHIEWQGTEGGLDYTYEDAVDCYLVDYDQGWSVEACLDS